MTFDSVHKLSPCNTFNNVINCHSSLLLDRRFKPPASCALHSLLPSFLLDSSLELSFDGKILSIVV